MARSFLWNGRKNYGTDTPWERHDDARRLSCNTVIANFSRRIEPHLWHLPEACSQVAQSCDGRGSEERANRAAFNGFTASRQGPSYKDTQRQCRDLAGNSTCPFCQGMRTKHAPARTGSRGNLPLFRTRTSRRRQNAGSATYWSKVVGLRNLRKDNELWPKVGDGLTGRHIMAVLTRRSSRREKDMPHEGR
jgi:hypothetical protein